MLLNPYRFGAPANVRIDMNFDGIDGGSTFTDTGTGASAWVRSGSGVTTSTEQILAGTASLRITGSSDYLETDYEADNRFPATGDWDFEFKFRASANTGGLYVFSVYDATSSGSGSVFSIYSDGGGLEPYFTNAANSFVNVGRINYSANTSYQWLLRRRGSTIDFQRDGGSLVSITFSDSIKTPAGLKWRIGKPPSGSSLTTLYIDDLRLTTY